MGEYLRGGHGATFDSNPAALEGIADDSTATIPNQCVKCFRIVDTVLTKVMQVQRLHMNLICDIVAFSDTGNRKETVEKQRNECERLDEEMKSLKETMFERVLCSGPIIQSSLVAFPRFSAGNSSPLSNIGHYTSEERDPINELKQECNVELIDENEDNLDSIGVVNSENRWRKLQSFTSLVDGKKKCVELSCVSETTRNDERNGVGSIFFVDTDAVAMSDVPVIKLENSQDDETVTTFEDSATGISQPEEMNVEEDPNPWFSDDTKDFLRTEEPIVKASNRTEVYKYATRAECLPVLHQSYDNGCNWPKDTPANERMQEFYETDELRDVSEAALKTEIYAGSSHHEDKLPSVRESSRYLRCGTCGLDFTRRKYLIQHIRSHNSEQSYRSKNTYGKTNNGKKSFVERGKPSYECNVCARKFLRNGGLTRHMRIHNGEKPYACEFCSKKCNQKSNLAKHMLTHNGEKPYRCEICGRTFVQKSDLTKHTRMHSGEKPYECENCGRKFSQRCYLLSHLRIHNGERPYGCEICGRKFIQRSDLTKHTRIHSGEKPYECESCGRKFSQRWNLINHLRIHNGEKPHRCEVCARKFRQKSDLTVHMRIHKGERPYECEVCARKFRRRSDLPSHMRIHTGEKPYECKVCAKRFRVKSGLVCHLFTHEKEKSYECAVCSRQFSESTRQVSNGERPVKCEDCAANSGESGSLAEHIRIQWQKAMRI